MTGRFVKFLNSGGQINKLHYIESHDEKVFSMMKS